MFPIATVLGTTALVVAHLTPPAFSHSESGTTRAFYNPDSPEDLDSVGVDDVKFFLNC